MSALLRERLARLSSPVELCPYLDYIHIWSEEDGVARIARKGRQAVESGPERLDQRRFAPANRKRLSAPALRTFLAIADLWRLTEEERRLVLGLPSRSTFHNWVKLAREHGELTLSVDVL